jgi:hypothetical protein
MCGYYSLVGKIIKYNYTQQNIQGTTNELLGELMTTSWARENETHIRTKNQKEILLTCLLYSGGVSLGKSNNSKSNSGMGYTVNLHDGIN